MSNVISIDEYKTRNDTTTLKVDLVDQDLEKSTWHHICPYKEGDLYTVNKTDCEELYSQSHPRKYRAEEPIIDVVDMDNNVEFWLSEAQLRSLVGA